MGTQRKQKKDADQRPPGRELQKQKYVATNTVQRLVADHEKWR